MDNVYLSSTLFKIFVKVNIFFPVYILLLVQINLVLLYITIIYLNPYILFLFYFIFIYFCSFFHFLDNEETQDHNYPNPNPVCTHGLSLSQSSCYMILYHRPKILKKRLKGMISRCISITCQSHGILMDNA